MQNANLCRTIRVWDVTAGIPAAPRYVLSGHHAAVRAIAFTADDKRLASVSGDPSHGFVWDMTAADPEINPIIPRGHNDVVRDVAVSPPKGRWIATAGWDQTARLWDMTSANPVLPKFADRVLNVAFSPDGHWLAAGANDSLTQLLDLRNSSAGPALLRAPQGRIFATVLGSSQNLFQNVR
jgi:WD40 repeat protein